MRSEPVGEVQIGGGSDDRFRRESVTSQVERLFCSSKTARYGPYELQDDGTEIVKRLVYRYKVLDRSQNQLSLQIFYGLRGIGGQLWEQEVRVLLRVGAIEHPALPRIADGGYDEDSNIAFVVTESTEYDLGAPEAIPFLQDRPAACVRQLGLLADALTVLHGQGLIHRNILPSSIQVVFEGQDTEKFRLQLARFEGSALISNLLRPVYAAGSENEREERLGRLKLEQGSYELAYCPPERLAEELETDRSDVYGLGVLAWQLFVGKLPAPLLDRGSQERDLSWLEELRSHMGAEISRKGLPARMQDLLRGMLRSDPRTRLSSTEVVSDIARHYDALLAPYESLEITEPYLVAFMPRESGPTVHEWEWIDHDPAGETGRRELFDFLDWELRRGKLVYSPEGADPFVLGGEASARQAAKYVLLGRRAAWFCVRYRKPNPFGGLGNVREEILLIKYVANRKRAHKLERQPFCRRLPNVEIVAEDAGDTALDRKRRGRPSWKPLLEAIQTEEHIPEWRADFERGLNWFLEYQYVELQARIYPYVIDQENGVVSRLRYDEQRDQQRIHRHPTALFTEYDMKRRLSFGDFFSDVFEDQSSGMLDACPDEQGRPQWRRRSQMVFERRLDDNLIEVSRTVSGGRIPREGWLRCSGDFGTESALWRQQEARPEFGESKSLLGQLHRPSTIAGFRHRWRGVGKGLRGGTDAIIKDILVSQPFYALHGPPGTGKTTVAAHAVERFLHAERSARILISAQSNFALDNLALRIRKQLEKAEQEIVAVRISSPSAEREDKVDKRLLDWTLNQKIPRLKDRIVALCENRLERKADPPPVRKILGRWKVAVETSQLELHDRIRRGANLVFATCVTATKSNVDAVGSFGVYDWVILEEAAKAWTTELAIPLVRGVRWTLIGDHLQLRPHKVEEVEAFLSDLTESKDPELKRHGESRYKYEKVFNLFGSLFRDQDLSNGRLAPARADHLAVPLGRLRRQFRMREPIARVVSRTFYRDPKDPDGPGQLETDSVTEVDSGLVAPEKLAGQALVWLDTGDVRGCEDQKWKNPGEVAVVAKLLEKMEPNPAFMETEGDEDPVAILTPYRDQITALKSVTLRKGWNRRIWSIHEYQGREANVVVTSLVRDQVRGNAAHKNIGYLTAPEIANVLISRARRLLVIVGSFHHFRKSGTDFWKVLCDSVESEGLVIEAAKVLKSLETRR